VTAAAPTRPRALRIGEVARMVGTTPRTIRYYEEIGLLSREAGRASGQHRAYDEHEVERLRDALRLKELLGLSLDELKTVLEAQEARSAIRAELREGDPAPARRRELLEEAAGHIERQLALVRRRGEEIAELERDLLTRRTRVRRKLAALND
jgi:MerR family transcriptional regulator, repressor of the yfmOP operon